MIFAAIGNINGNKNALEQVLSAIDEAGIQIILHTGDAVVGSREGNDILAMLARAGVICVQGGQDRLAVKYTRKADTLEQKIDPELAAAVREANESLTTQNLEALRDWRKTRTFDVEGIPGLLCHGSPGNPREVLTADTPVVKLQRQREQARAEIIVSGGAAEFFARTLDGTLFVSPGPLLLAPDLAAYALISTEETPWTAMLERVPLG